MNDQLPWYKQFWPWFIMLPPLAGVVGGISMLVLGHSQPPGLVVDDYANIDVRTQEKFDRDARARALALAAEITWDETGNDTLELSLRLTAGGRDPAVAPKNLVLDWSHPTHPERDFVTELSPGDGVYLGTVTPQPEGRYYLELRPQTAEWRLATEVSDYRLPLQFGARSE